MVSTNYAVGAAYNQPARAASAFTGQQPAVGQQESFTPSAREESVSPQVAYADTAAPSLNPAKMDTSFLTLVAAGVCALVVFSCCCSGNQNGGQ